MQLMLLAVYNRLSYLHDVLYKPHSNHRVKTFSRYAKDKEKGIKAYQYGKLPFHKQRQQEGGTRKL